MAKVWCCRRFQHADVFKITPTRHNILEEFILYNQCCSCCKNPVLEILRLDSENNVLKPVRLNSKNVPAFMKNMEIVWKPRKNISYKNKLSKFVLKYNEFGKIKNCFKSLSQLNIGQIETDPVINLKNYKKHLQSKTDKIKTQSGISKK